MNQNKSMGKPKRPPNSHGLHLWQAARVASPAAKDDLHGLRSAVIHRTYKVGYTAYAVLIGSGRGDRRLIAGIANPGAVGVYGRAVRDGAGDGAKRDPAPPI